MEAKAILLMQKPRHLTGSFRVFSRLIFLLDQINLGSSFTTSHQIVYFQSMKITLHFFKAFFLFLALATLVACKHEPEPEPFDCGEATSIDEMMEWIFFKTGTYWIYKEVNTGALDTCTVYYDYSGISSAGNREFLYKIKSAFDGYTYEYWFNDGWSGYGSIAPSCFIRAIDCDKFIPGDYAGGNHVFAFPLSIGNQCSQDGDGRFGSSKLVSYLEADTIGELVFQNVYVFNQDCSPQHTYKSSTYKLGKHIGILEKVIPDYNEKWELIAYQIIQ